MKAAGPERRGRHRSPAIRERRPGRWRGGVLACALPGLTLGLATSAGGAWAAAPAPAHGFTFTSAQAERGRAVYASACASCHGAKLQGGSGGTPLIGGAFMTRWTSGGRTLDDLHAAVRRMPRQSPGSLTDGQYDDVMAFMLAANGRAPRSGPRTAAPAPQPPPRPVAKAAILPSPPATVAAAQAAWPTDDELLHPRDGDWLMYNRDYKGQRYSGLAQINVATAPRLQPVCILQMGVPGSFMSSPIFYRGVGYVTTTYGVQAFDGATCERKWTYTYTPKGPETFPTNRGAALYDGKVFRGTTDGHLLAIDAVSGQVLWDVRVADSALGYFVGVAPVVYQGRVFTGLGGGEYGAPGRINAFDADTGKLLWTFNAIPTGSEPGAETWVKGAASGGGSTWTSFSVDPAEGLVYAPVGNPGPDFMASVRPGSNLYTNSIVALDAATGRLAWHVQQIAGDYHDWDTAAAPVLYEQDGRRLMAVGSKNGLVYIYDRDTHALIAKVPVTTLKNTDVPLSFDKPVMVCPGGIGGVEWYGPAYDPNARALFVGSVDWCGAYKLEKPAGFKAGSLFVEGTVDFAPPEEQRGWLKALDAVTGKELWSYKAPRPMVAGVTPTAGGVLLTGGTDGDFLVFDQKDGRILYRFHTGGAVAGGVSTYLVGDRQFVAAASGNRSVMPFGIQGSPTLVVFALPEGPN